MNTESTQAATQQCAHYWASVHEPDHKLFWLQQCLLCHRIDWDDLDAQIRELYRTPNSSLQRLVPDGPRRKMLIEIEVAADFEKRLDNQWEVEREINADRWSWSWPKNEEGRDRSHLADDGI